MPNCSVSDRLVLELVTDEETDLNQLSSIVEENPSLAALVIGLANSAYFSAPNPIHSVSDAIIKVLGMRMVRSIILSVILGKTLDLSKCPNFSVTDYWTDALAIGRFSQLLTARSEFSRSISPEQVYLCGLLCHFGQLVLIHHYPREMNELIDVCDQDADAFIAAQEEILGVTESQAGGLMGRRWLLPEEVVMTMQHCFDTNYRGEHWHVSQLVGAVGRMVMALRRGEEATKLPENIELILRKPSSQCRLEELKELREEFKLVANHLVALG